MPPHHHKNILIVDPIFRGSRLVFSWIVASGAAARGYIPHILTRTEAKTAHYHELFSNVDHTLHETIGLPSTFWYGKIEKPLVEKTIQKIKEYDGKLQFDFIYFAGLNEYYPLLVEMLNREDGIDKKKKIIIVDYDATCLIRPRNNPGKFYHSMLKSYLLGILKKGLVKKEDVKKRDLIETLSSTYPNLKIALLDERAFDKKLGLLSKRESRKFVLLPDPGPLVRIKAKPVRSEKTRILLVGIQSKRKGIEDVVKLLETGLLRNEFVHFTLSGSFPEETGHLKARVAAMKAVFEFREGYFSEETIQETYQQCDYVMLPYDKTFHGSSGVMGYAAAFGKPLITTTHGCIGFRVGKFGLGFSYESGNVLQLSEIIDRLPNRDAEIYREMSRNCNKFSLDHSIDEHQRILFASIGGVNTP